MNKKTFQLVGLDKHLGLYNVPVGYNEEYVQECFNEVIEDIDQSDEELEIGLIDEILEERFNITRIWIEEVFTYKL